MNKQFLFPYSISGSQNFAKVCNKRLAYTRGTFMVTFTSKHNGVDFQKSTVQTANTWNKEKGNESKFPFSLFDFELHRT